MAKNLSKLNLSLPRLDALHTVTLSVSLSISLSVGMDVSKLQYSLFISLFLFLTLFFASTVSICSTFIIPFYCFILLLIFHDFIYLHVSIFSICISHHPFFIANLKHLFLFISFQSSFFLSHSVHMSSHNSLIYFYVSFSPSCSPLPSCLTNRLNVN